MFWEMPGTEHRRFMDASGMDVDWVTLQALKNSGRSFRWETLSLSNNPKVNRPAVEALCDAIRGGRLNPRFIDLRATDYDATPYLEWLDDDHVMWRRPARNRELEKIYGYQRCRRCTAAPGS